MKTLLSYVVIAVLLLTGVQAQTGGSQFFVKITSSPAITGESVAHGHENEIDAFAFKLGVSQKGITDFGGGASAGKAQFLPVVIHKNVDLSSPGLFLACATGKRIPKVELKAARFDGSESLVEYLVVTLSDVVISSVNHESADANSSTTVLESVSLNFAKIEISYRKQNPDGSFAEPVKTGYDVRLNKKI